MLDPKSQNALVVPEGSECPVSTRKIDKRLGPEERHDRGGREDEGREPRAARMGGRRPGIKDPLEGFLFPAAYAVPKGTKPEDVLKKMVARAKKEYGKLDLEAEREEAGSEAPLEVSPSRASSRRRARRTTTSARWRESSTTGSSRTTSRPTEGSNSTRRSITSGRRANWSRRRRDLRRTTTRTTRTRIKGLPPGPITNPGADAPHSALNPTAGRWYYFVSVTEDKTVFAVTNEEHERNRKEYEENKADQ